MEDGIDWVRALCVELPIPALRAWGITETDFPRIVEEAARASSMRANPLPLTREELFGYSSGSILEAGLGSGLDRNLEMSPVLMG